MARKPVKGSDEPLPPLPGETETASAPAGWLPDWLFGDDSLSPSEPPEGEFGAGDSVLALGLLSDVGAGGVADILPKGTWA
jgi:hypothetical protein